MILGRVILTRQLNISLSSLASTEYGLGSISICGEPFIACLSTVVLSSVVTSYTDVVWSKFSLNLKFVDSVDKLPFLLELNMLLISHRKYFNMLSLV